MGPVGPPGPLMQYAFLQGQLHFNTAVGTGAPLITVTYADVPLFPGGNPLAYTGITSPQFVPDPVTGAWAPCVKLTNLSSSTFNYSCMVVMSTFLASGDVPPMSPAWANGSFYASSSDSHPQYTVTSRGYVFPGPQTLYLFSFGTPTNHGFDPGWNYNVNHITMTIYIVLWP